MAKWSFLTSHARALVCIAHDPGLRLRDIAVALGITERSAYAIVTDLTEDGYIVKEKDGRRNRYHIQGDLPLPESVGRSRTVGEVLHLLAEARGPADGEAPAGELGVPVPTSVAAHLP
ncbi:MAG: hypothetical protein QOJ69_525 [Actinomycetota bacterium]|jgi:hypothetical protein|nr:hypothetical protein [Actinomycetota bacterium]